MSLMRNCVTFWCQFLLHTLKPDEFQVSSWGILFLNETYYLIFLVIFSYELRNPISFTKCFWEVELFFTFILLFLSVDGGSTQTSKPRSGSQKSHQQSSSSHYQTPASALYDPSEDSRTSVGSSNTTAWSERTGNYLTPGLPFVL